MKIKLAIILFILIAHVGFAQKSTSDALTVQLLVQPAIALPPSVKSYSAHINTPIFPLTPEETREAERSAKVSGTDDRMGVRQAAEKKMEDYKKIYLDIAGRTRVPENGDLSVIVTTTKTKITNKTTVPLSQLKMKDEVFRFSVSATLQLLDRTGTVLHTAVLIDSAEDISVIKATLYTDLKTIPLSGKRPVDAYVPEALVLEKIMVLADQALADAVEVQEPKFIVAVFSVKGKVFAPLGDAQEAVKEAYGKFHAFNKKNRISKEDMGKTLQEAQVVWEKFMTEKQSEMDERAYKGLALNCALACAWNNEFDKARSWVAKLSAADLAAAAQHEDEPPVDPPMGAVIMLSFEEYAFNVQKFVRTLNNNQGRVEIIQ